MICTIANRNRRGSPLRNTCTLVSLVCLLCALPMQSYGVESSTETMIFIDRSGKETTAPKIQISKAYIEGMASLSGMAEFWKQQYADGSGGYVAPAYPRETKQRYEFCEGVNPSPIFVNGTGFFLDQQGVVAITVKGALNLTPFSEGYAAFATKQIETDGPYIYTNYGFIDRSGKIVVAPTFDEVLPFVEGLSAVRQNDKWGFVDKSGKFVIEPKFYSAHSFNDGFAPVQVQKYEETKSFDEPIWTFIDKEGKRILGDKGFMVASSFSEGLAAVCPLGSNRYGYIDKTGKVVIEPQFESAGDFSEGLAAVSMNGKFGYIDVNGQFVIQPQYLDAEKFYGGVASVKVSK